MGVVSTLKHLLRNPKRHKDAAANTIKEPAYRRRFRRSIADWLIYHQEKIHFTQMHWMGVKILKNPLDCWIYQEILWEVRPDVVVELGSLAGGSTLFLCHMLDLIGSGQVVSVDRDRSRYQAKHARLVDVTGDCSEPKIIEQIHALCHNKRTILIHDADHGKDAVLRDLRHYAAVVSIGGYLIVEDGIVDLFGGRSSRRLRWNNQPGPLAAVREFLDHDPRFVVDKQRERYMITSNPCGYLRRVS